VARYATVIGSSFIAIAIACVASLAAADDRARMSEPFEISADRIVFDNARNLYVAEGRVRVDQVGRRLKANWLAFSSETRIGVAQGQVELEDGPDTLRAEFMVFDADTLHGMLFQGSLDLGENGFQIRAKEIVRTGQNTFTVRDGAFTTCRCEPGERLPWEIHSENAEVEVGGYGTVTNSTFDVLGVPVLWVPWAFFPVSSERKTGLLLPTIEFGGRGGATVGLPFFWAALPQLNVTFTPHYFVDRGYKQDVEFEYVFDKRSEGRLFLSGLADDRKHDSQSTFNKERWAVLWEHDQELPAELRWQTDLKLSSDNLYSDDFAELRDYRTFRFIESTSNLARDFGASGGYGAMLAARYADDAQGSTFDDRDQLILQRWAEVRADILPGSLRGPLGLETRVDMELIHFESTRDVDDELAHLEPLAPPPLTTDGRFADLGFDGKFGTPGVGGEDDGLFEPGEPVMDRGTRLVIHPRVARTFRLGGIAEFVPEVGWQQTLYNTHDQDFAERGLFTARGDLRGRLARDYFAPGGHAIRHLIEPALGWAYVSQTRQKGNPLFIPRGTVDQSRLRALSLENVTRNPSDRIENVNQFVLSLGQKFYLRPNASSAPRLAVDLVTGVDWDFAGNRGLGNFYVEGRLFPGGRFSGRVRGAFDLEKAEVQEGEIGLNFRVPWVDWLVRNAILGTDYRYRSQLARFAESVRGSPSTTGTGDTVLNQLDVNATIELTERVRLRYQMTNSFAKDSGLILSRGILDYVSKCRCWGVGFSVFQEREQGVGGGIEIRFLGLGDGKGSLFDSGIGFGQSFQGS
jgi:lipopolysaccharide assembly outer membrane protein LptD (OstA)